MAKKQKVPLGRSLADVAPEIASQWHPTRNGDLAPADIFSASNSNYWWKCDVADDHEWVAKPNNRTSNQSGCPFCNGKKVSVTNSLASLNPEVAAEWHPTKNNGLTPDHVVAGSASRYWWKWDVADDHEWKTSPGTRLRMKSGCPFCAGKKVSVTNSLETLNPALAAEWHPTKNGEVTPDDVVSGSHSKFWWKCDVADDHEWERRVSGRTSSQSGCPFCDGKKVSITNSLASLNPEVAAEWHPTRNGDVTPADVVAGSHLKFWWKCDVADDHEWSTQAVSRTRVGSGCPHCKLTPRSAQEIRLAYELSAIINFDLEKHKIRLDGKLRDVDIVLDDLGVIVEFDGVYWHRNKIEIDRQKTNLMEDAGWTVIRVRERPLDSIHINDVIVNTNAPAKAVADLVLTKITTTTKVAIPKLCQYLESPEPWRESEARDAIRLYLVEREAKKAKRRAKLDA